MNHVLKLRQRFTDLVTEEEALLNLLIEENRASTPEEEKRLAEIDASKKNTITLLNRATVIEEERSSTGITVDEEDETRATPATVPAQPAPRMTITRAEGEDEQGRYLPFKSFGEQLQTIRRAASNPHRVDPRLLEMNKRAAAGLNEGIGADGGFLLQMDFNTSLMEASFETGLLSKYCLRLPVSAGKSGIEFPMVDETSRVDGSRFGGIQVYWAAEAEAAQKSKPKFTIQRLGFEKLLGMAVVTDEMLEDAAFLGAFISKAFREEFGYKIDDGIIRGTGVGQMLGILNSNALITVAKETSQAADSIVGMNVVKMRARLLSRARKGMVWIANQDCDAQIQTLTITKDKSDVPLYNPADGLNKPLDSILGRPVESIEQASTVGDVGDIIAADLGYYALIMRDMKEASSIHAYFDTEQTAFRFSMRINGQPILKGPITPAHGPNTLSAFVALAERA